MADNTVLPSGAGGDTVRTIDHAGIKTQVAGLDFGGEAGPEVLVTLTNGLPVQPATGSTFAISAASLPLPTGASTGAKQDTGNTSLTSIDGKTPALGQALAAASSPVVLTAAQITTLTPPAAISGFALEAGNIATLVARQPVLGAATIANSSPVNIASDQTVAVSAASLPLPSGAATAALQTTAQATLTTLTNLVDQHNQIIKLLSAILMTLGNNGNGFVQPEEASELSTLQ